MPLFAASGGDRIGERRRTRVGSRPVARPAIPDGMCDYRRMEVSREPVEFVIITALEEERDAILTHLGSYRKLEKDGADVHTYFEADVSTSRDDEASYRIIVTTLADMGPIRAATKASHVVARWTPRKVLLVGIAGGVSGGAELGDVVVANQIADYTVGKVHEDGSRVARWVVHPVDASLLDSARNDDPAWKARIAAARPHPGTPTRRIGVVASGGDVIAFASLVREHHQIWEKLVAIEMEGGGVASALHDTVEPPGFLMIRGVSDLADAADNGPTKARWRAYACDVAAAYAVALLRGGPLPRGAQASGGTPRLRAADLLRVSRAITPGQLRATARQKYVEDLYVPRAATAALAEVGSAEQRFRGEVESALQRLTAIAQSYPLPGASLAVEQASTALLHGLVLADLERAVQLLVTAFKATAIEQLLAEIQVAMRARRFELSAALARIRAILKTLPIRTNVDHFMACLDEAMRTYLASGAAHPDSVLALLPGDGPASAPVPVTDILTSLRAACERFCRRATALVGPAGMGKTNALCALVTTLQHRLPVLFIEGHGDIDGATLQRAVQRAVERAADAPVHDWREALRHALDGPTSWLVLCIDGIEESANLARTARAIEHFLGLCEDLRIHVVLSCRDIAWEAFHDRLRTLLIDGRPTRLDAFTDSEWAAASRTYLERFRIRCSLGPAAQAVLRHPLLLRLFCETYRERDLGGVADLRPLEVFERYFEGVTRRVAEQTGMLRPTSAVAFLEQVAVATWRARGAVVPAAIGLTHGDLAQRDSLYNLFRSEGVLSEVAAESEPSGVVIHFAYSQTAEFLIARQWTRALGPAPTAAALDGVLASVVAAVTEFPAAVGVVVFLDRLRNAGGVLVSRFMYLLVGRGDEVLMQLQTVVPYAFDHVAVQEIDASVSRALVRLEATARPEIREALAPGMLRIIAAKREDPELRHLAARILGVSLDEILHPPVRRETSAALVLPPPRYRYRYETRLSALRILAGQGSESAADMVVRGIRQLGQQDLHAALIAFRALDAAPEPIIFQVIERYLSVVTPEYRIFAAWLLRHRQDGRAAEFLVLLLTDPDHRVHDYTSRLVRKQTPSRDLVEHACRALLGPPPRPWHVRNLFSVLRRADHGRTHGSSASSAMIREAALRWARDPNCAVRVAAYRALVTHGHADDVHGVLAEESDPLVRDLARAAM
jgi:adenosylhomocysteine nucleosidase